jgi:ATP synthase protein I
VSREVEDQPVLDPSPELSRPMAGAANTPGRKGSDRDTEGIKRRLHELEERLGRVRARHKPAAASPQDGRGPALGQALRLATELVAGVAVGGFIGWALDRFFGSAPFLMVLFLILGAAAGIANVMRTAQAMQVAAGPLPGKDLPRDAEDEDE